MTRITKAFLLAMRFSFGFAKLGNKFHQHRHEETAGAEPIVDFHGPPRRILVGGGNVSVQVSITTDGYPLEISWYLQETQSERIVADSPMQSYKRRGLYTTMVEKLDSGKDYTFTILDSAHDGICCGYGQGEYIVKMGDVILASGAEYGASESTTFTVEAPAVTTPSPTTISTSSRPMASPTPSPTTLNNADDITGGCQDPLAAVLDTLKCVEKEQATCAAAGYSRREFRKIHNGMDTNTEMSPGFWTGAFALLDFGLDLDFAMNIGPNQASVRYVEMVRTTDGSAFFRTPSNTYPFNQTFYQHEHALVTVNDDCQIVLWDQYGDNKEQTDVDNAADAILCESIGNRC